MNIYKAVISLVAIGLFGAALAQEETRVKIEVISDDASHEAIRIDLDGEQLGFDLHDMQEGENQAIVDDQGRTILVTRNADGFTFEVDGKSIEMPMIHGDHEKMIALHEEHAENVEVHVVHKVEGDHDETHDVKIVKKVEIIAD